MEQSLTEGADYLLQSASDRLKSVSGDVSAFNLLSVLRAEHFETKTHSKIIFYLLNDSTGQNVSDSFLMSFLKVLDIPKKYLDETWSVRREQSFAYNSDSGRMDFVIESKSCCVIIEMKVYADDGDSQIIRYDSFGQNKKKVYFLYYLTLDGHKPEEQSAGETDEDKLRCISFKKEIILWLRECMKCVDKRGYKYSFLKQYLGAVRQITDTNDEVISVKDLLDSSDMLKAAQLVADSFYEKIDDITACFFEKLDKIIRRRTKLATELYVNELDIYLNEFTYRKRSYRMGLYIVKDINLECRIAFESLDNNEYLRIDDAKKIFPTIYRASIEKLENMEGVPKLYHYPRSKYFFLEDSRGNRLNFKDYTAQIELIDEMDQQCKYISDYIINFIINPLLED